MKDWTYINGEVVYTPSLLKAIADLTYDKYNEEHDEMVADLKMVADAAVREAAAKLRTEAAEWEGWPEKQENMQFSANLIDPDKREV